MRKLLLLLAFLPAFAFGQYYGPVYNPANVKITGGTAAFTGTISTTGNVNVQGNISSTNNINPAGTTNSGVALSASPNVADVLLFDSTQSANNRTYEMLAFQGCQQFRFKNDAGSSATAWLNACGGYAAGVTSIASTGPWTHTGTFGVAQSGGNGIALQPSANGGTPTLTTNGANSNVSLNISTQGGGGINLNSATAVTGTFSVTSTSTLTGAVSMPGGTNGPLTISQGYTVATLPTCNTASKGARAYVTDAATPTFNSPVTGSNSNTVPVFCNGNSWVAG
jgi:hypothetical protein